MNNIDKAKLFVIGLAGGLILQMVVKKDADMDDCIYICRKLLDLLEDQKQTEKTRNIFS